MTALAFQDPQEQDDPVVAAVKLMVEHGVPKEEIEAYVAKKRGYSSPIPPTGHNGVPFVDAKLDGEPGVGTKALGTAASLMRDMPGGEALQAGSRALARTLGSKLGLPVAPESYPQARDEIRGGEDAAPAAATVPARIAGGVASMAAIPGGPVLQGARFGILSGLGQSDPATSLKDRLHAAAFQGGVDATAAAAIPYAKAIPPVFDLALSPVSKGAARRTAGRVVGAIRGALTDAAPAEAAPVEAAVQEAPAAARAASTPARQSHRTAAQFQHFAERMGQEPPPSSLDKQLRDALAKAKTFSPEETGSTYGDAEEAMGLAPHQQPDLEDLLRRSLDQLPKGKPSTLEDVLQRSIKTNQARPPRP